MQNTLPILINISPSGPPLNLPNPHDAGQSVKQWSANTVKKVVLSLILSTVAFGTVLAPQRAQAQSPGPHKIGLIDMAYIFKNYKKFTDLREDLKKEIERSDSNAKQMVAEITVLQKKMKDGQKTFKQDSPQFKQWRTQLIEMSGKYQVFRQDEQRRFLGKESQIYKTVYLEVTNAVRIYAKYWKFTLILRWNKDGVDSADNAKTILGRMNRLVIYSRDGDDITAEILKHLNKTYRPKR